MIATGRQHRLAVFAVGGAAATAAVILAVGNPSHGGFPQCPFHQATGLYCPGCGTQRALHALLHLQIGSALGYNVLAVCALPFLVYSYFAWAAQSLGTPSLRLPRLVPPPWLMRALPGIVIGFAVVRNLPFGRVLAP